jgi:hypothetical protein
MARGSSHGRNSQKKSCAGIRRPVKMEDQVYLRRLVSLNMPMSTVFRGIQYQYPIPTTMAKSSSTNFFTYSTIALGTGHRTMSSLKHSITHIAVTPTTVRARISPAVPTVWRTSPIVENMVTPMMPLSARSLRQVSEDAVRRGT